MDRLLTFLAATLSLPYNLAFALGQVSVLEHRPCLYRIGQTGGLCKTNSASKWLVQKTCPVYLHGPRNFSVRDVWEAFEKVTGKKVRVELVEKEGLQGFFEHSPLPANLVDEFFEMTLTFLPGGLLEEEINDLTNAVRGNDTLVDSVSRMWRASQNA